MVREAMQDFIADMEYGLYNGGFSDYRKLQQGMVMTKFTLSELSIFCQQMDFFEPKCIHQKQIEILQCHRDTNRLFWSWAPMHPQCRYGQT